ncbi:MAG: hypothetical protein P8P74_09035 [Crocinitomicaceae bacterium]|nr:hypothetical protein [Crocinitomicaceae bacterium]
MKLRYKGRNANIKKAMKIANKILNDQEFYKKIDSFGQFDNTEPLDLSSVQISSFIKNHSKSVYVKTYIGKPGTNAKTNRSTNFKLNRINLGRPTNKIVRTMIHEYVHCIDFSLRDFKFTHVDNDNSTGDENNTAPWAIAQIAFEMINK